MASNQKQEKHVKIDHGPNKTDSSQSPKENKSGIRSTIKSDEKHQEGGEEEEYVDAHEEFEEKVEKSTTGEGTGKDGMTMTKKDGEEIGGKQRRATIEVGEGDDAVIIRIKKTSASSKEEIEIEKENTSIENVEKSPKTQEIISSTNKEQNGKEHAKTEKVPCIITSENPRVLEDLENGNLQQTSFFTLSFSDIPVLDGDGEKSNDSIKQENVPSSGQDGHGISRCPQDVAPAFPSTSCTSAENYYINLYGKRKFSCCSTACPVYRPTCVKKHFNRSTGISNPCSNINWTHSKNKYCPKYCKKIPQTRGGTRFKPATVPKGKESNAHEEEIYVERKNEEDS